MPNTDFDCVIIGGGPAGLTAATYLGRFRRRVLLVDGGASRAAWIPVTHNLIGFAKGISGADLLQRMREQVSLYEVEHLSANVDGLVRSRDGNFQLSTGGKTVSARYVLLATGGLDVEPDLPHIRQAVKEGLVRYCPVCDAFEVSGERVGLIAYGKCRVREALLLRGYTADLTVLTLGQQMVLDNADERQLRQSGINIIRDPVVHLARQADGIAALIAGRDHPLIFDTIYAALGTRIRSALAIKLGAQSDSDGALVVNTYQQTTVPGLYAAGDVVRGLSQISIAAAQAAIAATHINAELPPVLFPG